MFTFGFSSEDNNEGCDGKDAIEWLDSKEVLPNGDNIQCINKMEEDVIIYRSYDENCLKYINPQRVINKLMESKSANICSSLQAEKNNSDLIPGVYEGGLKVWECTHDLCDFIAKSKMEFCGKRVLDLGCGSGLVGILCYKLGSVSYMQDYNEDVLRHFTISNTMLNEDIARPVTTNCKYYSGDWLSFLKFVNENDESDKFDFIFTSETIYNMDNYSKLHQIFERCLKKDGKIYLAAKYYYFGVGGGIPSFKEILDQKSVFSYTTCWEHTNGIRREILEIKFRNPVR